MTQDSRYPTLSGDTMDSIRGVFFEECEENLGALETGLLALQDGAEDWEIINTVFRAVHSIKGGASIFGLEVLVDFAHLFESALSQGAVLHRNPFSRVAWRRLSRGAALFVAGQSYPMPVADARRLAAATEIDLGAYARLGAGARAAVVDLAGAGHYQAGGDEEE